MSDKDIIIFSHNITDYDTYKEIFEAMYNKKKFMLKKITRIHYKKDGKVDYNLELELEW